MQRLLDADGSVSVTEISDELGMHQNTVRFHLEGLVDAGYAIRETEDPQGHGRPRVLYRSTTEAPEVDDHHLLDIAHVLLRHFVLDASDPQQVAEETGESWGRELAGAERSSRPEAALSSLAELTQSLGFSTTLNNDSLEFDSCPYRDLNGPAKDSLCNMHLGMIRGYLEAVGADVEVEELERGPICRARLN